MSKDYEEFIQNNIKKNLDFDTELQVTIDISMYPIKKEFIKPIKSFIQKINTYKNLKITTYPTCTVVQGEFKHAMQSVKDCILACNKDCRSIYVMKVITGYKALD